MKSSQSLWGRAIAATTAVVLVGTGWELWSRDDPPAPPAGGSHRLASAGQDDSPVAAVGARIVGYRGLMLTLPGRWETPASCGHGASRIVTFASTELVANCPLLRKSDAPEVVVRFDDSIVGPPSLLGKTVPGGTIGGEQVLLTDVSHRGRSYSQALAMPGKNFYVSVSAQRRALVNRIVESAEAVPRGYTAVPSVLGLRTSLAVRRLTAAGLVLGEPKRPLASCCAARVTTQSPDAGSVVKAGTAFRLRG